jgi:hypothetical protein
MNARDELKKVIYTSRRNNTQVDLRDDRRLQGSQLAWAGYAADAVLAAGYRKPRIITTAEELDALPVGSVVRMSGTSEDARVAVKDGTWKSESEWFVADGDEWCLDSTELDDLPATVLHEPEARS